VAEIAMCNSIELESAFVHFRNAGACEPDTHD
jgi:hypothetical protein